MQGSADKWRIMVSGRQLMVGMLFVALIGSAGCTLQKDRLPWPEPPPIPLQYLTLWLEVTSEVQAGETVPLKLKVKNTGKCTFKLSLGGRPAYDFIVTKLDGTEVWRWLHGLPIRLAIEERFLQSGEELEFAADWNQQDNDGNPVPPGTYFVQGVLRVLPEGKGPSQQLKTEQKRLIILP